MSDDRYTYTGEPEARSFGPLPEGDYAFIVGNCDNPYKSKAGNWVLPVEILILPDKQRVFANPWSGVDKNGENRDGIADFLHAINRVPKVGEEPRWAKLIGARGRCRLVQEESQQGKLAGKMVNKVAWFYRPREVGPTTEEQPRSFTKEEVEASRKATTKAAERDPDLDVAPDDIPFKTTIYHVVKTNRLSRRFIL